MGVCVCLYAFVFKCVWEGCVSVYVSVGMVCVCVCVHVQVYISLCVCNIVLLIPLVCAGLFKSLV